MLWHVRGKSLLHAARHLHGTCHWGLLDKLGQHLAVVAVEADAFEPTVKDCGLILPVLGQGLPLQHHSGQHHIAHIVPDARVHELDAPLLRQVSADLVADLLTALVDEVGEILPRDLRRVDIEDAPRCRHIPGGGVAGTHVENHVHVLEREGATRIEQLVILVRTCKEGVVFEEVNLRTLREIIGLPLRQKVQAEVVVDTKTLSAGGGTDMEVLVVPVRNDHPRCRRFVDLRCRDGIFWVRL
mmetsp:Transcript_99978/g.214155  ORF Transcript_99978/g.214155 Transcript_99978/m.214155 type:complete len:242 (-) Transcript_99978:608-1333(-)